jgi:predicted dehydrogenase
MNIGVVGCGYVAEQYANTLPLHPELTVVGALDREPPRAAAFAKRTNARAYPALDALLNDPAVELIVNLTNPGQHFEINRASLNAGKHVYSEKPLAMTTGDAMRLVDLARANQRHLVSAPCSVLSPSAQTLWQAIRRDAIGAVRVVYANFDDGMIAPNLEPWNWRSDDGVPWPAADEFEVGSTYEHAGYVVTWLCAMFGPARRIFAFASVQIPDKGIAVRAMAPDFSVGCIEFDAGVVARVTCGLAAPRDKSITVVGDRGTLMVGNVRDDNAPVMWRPAHDSAAASFLRRRLPAAYRWLQSRLSDAGAAALFAKPYPGVGPSSSSFAAPGKRVDFLRGPQEMVEAIGAGRQPRLAGEFAAHLVEIVERLQYPQRFKSPELTTTFPRVEPMAWAV